jgi:hypothetical protein
LTEHEYKRLSAPVDLAAERAQLSPERRNATDAMKLYMTLSRELRFAVAERERNAYRRRLRAFKRAARRLARRYDAITPMPTLKLGNIHRAPAMPRPAQPTPATTNTLAAAA